MRQLIRGHVLIIQLIGTFAARIVNMHAGKVLGLQTTVLVVDPPKLVCRVLFGSYNWGLKGFILVNFNFTLYFKNLVKKWSNCLRYSSTESAIMCFEFLKMW